GQRETLLDRASYHGFERPTFRADVVAGRDPHGSSRDRAEERTRSEMIPEDRVRTDPINGERRLDELCIEWFGLRRQARPARPLEEIVGLIPQRTQPRPTECRLGDIEHD